MTQIHPTAIIESGAELDHGVSVGPFCRIGSNVKVGKGTTFQSHVVVEGHSSIGSDNTFFPFSVIGAVPQDLKYKGEPTRLIIGDNNTIRESVTLNLGTVQGGGETRVGNGNLIMAYVHLGHDTVVHNGTILANSVQVAGHAIIEDYANVGGLTGIIQYVRVGAYTYVGAFSSVEKDAPPFSVVLGSRPCILRGANIVGLRRRGFAPDQIMRINESLKLWGRSDVPKEQCLVEIESQFGEYSEIQTLTNFIRKSDTGVIRS